MSYHTKKDRWILILVGFFLLLNLVGGITLLAREADRHLVMGILALCLVVGTVVLVYPVRYQITDTELLVRAGPFRWKIALQAIEEVYPTRNPLPAPAWSLDRLHLTHRHPSGRRVFLLISPEDREKFVEELARKCPDLMRSDDRLVKKPRPVVPPPAETSKPAPPAPPPVDW